MSAPNLSEHPWMEHNLTGHRAQLPDEPYWRANGWSPCDGPPPEPNLTREPEPEAPDAEEAPGLPAAQPKKATKAGAKTPVKDEEEA